MASRPIERTDKNIYLDAHTDKIRDDNEVQLDAVI